MIVAEPVALPVTTIESPVEALIVALEELLVVQETFPLPPIAVAVSVTVPLTGNVADDLFNVIVGVVIALPNVFKLSLDGIA